MKTTNDAGMPTGKDDSNVKSTEKKDSSDATSDVLGKTASQLPLCQVNGMWNLMSLPSVYLLPLEQRIPPSLEADAIPDSLPSHKVDEIREIAKTMGIEEVNIATTADQARHAYDSIFRPPAWIELSGDELRNYENRRAETDCGGPMHPCLLYTSRCV